MADSLDHAASERKGVAVVGEKGSGKTIALRTALDEFENVEREAQAVDANHEPRRVVLIHSPRSNLRRETLSVIWKAVMGMELNGKVRGRAKPDDLLLEEVVEQLLHQCVAVLVFDEAESLTDESLLVIREIISLAETRSKERYSVDNFAAAGVGVLLVGTPDLKTRLSQSNEAGQRWVRVQKVRLLEPREAAEVYEKFLPGLAPHIKKVGRKGWTEFIRIHVARGQPVSIRLIANHVRNYARRMEATEEISTIEDISFNEELSTLLSQRRRTIESQTRRGGS